MQQISSNYKNEIKQPSRHFECRVTIGKNIYTNESIVDIILDYPQAIDGFSIGNTTSQSLDLTLLNTGEEIYSTNQIKVEIGLQVGSDFEYILMGYYNVDEVSKNDYTIKFTAFDNMMKFETPYFSSLGAKPTLQQVVNELVTITGVSFVGSIPSYTVTKLEGYTCREVLSYVASLCGGNALITRDGKFTIKTLQVVDCSVTTENHFGLTTEEVPYKLGKITCLVDEENEVSKGATGTDSMELSFENPWMTESILNTLYRQLNGFSYLGFQAKWQGDLSLDPYDLISIQDKKGTSYKAPILNQKFIYVGGLTSEIAAKGESKNKNSFSSSGPTANKTNRLVTEQAIIKEALINKASIQDLEAVSIRTQTLEATTAKIQDAIIDVAHISDLNAVNAKIESLQATDVTIQNAIINKADISELNAAVANINILNADLGVIKHLVNGNLSSENIQAGGITSDKLTIANGFIKDAMIDSLNANKITAGQINTALVQVSSASGNLVINDNTIQIRDANRVRVQIGKDASNDYSMSVWDSNGKLMFDARGLKADAIKDSIIRDDMISANANIDGSKLNISSVVSSINHGSSTLKASKVQFDGIAQTLEVAFNALKTQADGTKTQTESNTTAISAAQGEIKILIQDTTITKDGVTTTLKDEYSRLEQTVSGLNSTIGKQQTIIDDHSGKITSTNSELSTMKQSVNGLSASVSSAQTTINSHTTLINQKADLTAVNDKINSAKNELNTSINKKANAVDVYTKSEVYTKSQTDSAINIAKDAINLGVSSTYETKTNVESKINGIQVGGRNLAQQSHRFNKGGGATGITSISNSDGSISVTASSGNGNWFTSFIVTNAGIENNFNEGDTFTISFIVSSENTTKIPSIYIKPGMGYYPMKGTLSSKDSVIYYTGTWKKANGISIHLGFNGIVGTITFKKWKLEKGNKVTDWSPAPEDITADIAEAKNEAINSAIADATNKVNSAKNELNTAIGKKANATDVYTKSEVYTKTQTDSAINVAKNAITQSVSNTYETKTEVTNKINGIQVGSRNLVINSTFNKGLWNSSYSTLIEPLPDKPNSYITEISRTYSTDINTPIYNPTRIYREYKKGDTVTISFDFYCENFNTYYTNGTIFTFRYSDVPSGGTITSLVNAGYAPFEINTTLHGKWQRAKYVYTFDRDRGGYFIIGLYLSSVAGSCATTVKHRYREIKLEEGNKATDWSPAPEDVETTVSNLTQRVTSAESKITDTAITNVVKQNFYTKTETNNQITSKGYQTASQVQQTVDNLQIKFTQSGGYNLIRNGSFENGNTYWVRNGSFTDGRDQWSPYGSGTSWVLWLNKAWSGFYQAFNCRVGQTYSWSMDIYVEKGTCACGIENVNQEWWDKTNGWQRMTGTFVAKNNSHVFTLYTPKDGETTIHVDNIMVCEGSIPSAYTPHPSEIYDGITTIDKDGMKVTASNINGYTHMTARGFFINKNNTDIFKVDGNGLMIRGSGVNSGRYIKIENEDYTVWNGNINCMRFGYKNWNGWDGVPEFLMGYKGFRYSETANTGEDASYFGMQTWGRWVRNNPNAYHEIYYRSDRFGDTSYIRFDEDGTVDYRSLGQTIIKHSASGHGIALGKYVGKDLSYVRPTLHNATDLGHESYRYRTIYATNGNINTSDISLKENISPIVLKANTPMLLIDDVEVALSSEDYYEFVKTMPMYTYDYKSKDDEKDRALHNVGFIAQDIADTAVGNEFVFKGEDGLYQYNMQGYVGVLAVALQKAINEIELLKIQLNTR